MTEHKSSYYTGAVDGQPQTKLDGRKFNASLAAYHVVWTGDAAQNDTLKLFKTNKGFVPQFVLIDRTALGSSVVLDFGDGTTADRWINGFDASGAGQTLVAVEDPTPLVGEDVIVTFLGANPASGTLKITLFGLTI